MHFDFLVATAIGVIGLFIAIFGVYYTKHSYLLTLKTYEKDKKRSEKAKYYYDSYINIPPNQKVSIFKKKVDSDDLNEGVGIPSEFTDYLIRNFPDQYFHLSALLKKSWKYFEIVEVNTKKILICKIKYFVLRQIWYFFLYFVYAMGFTFLILYSDIIIHKITIDNPWGALMLISMVAIGLLAFTIHSLFKTTQISEADTLNNYLKKLL